MADKVFNGRIIHKNDIEENWKKAINFIPKKSELIIYNPDNTHAQARVKVGDGVTKVNDLPFTIDDVKQVTTVNGKTGASIVLTGDDIPFSAGDSSENTVKYNIDGAWSLAETAQTTAETAQTTAETAQNTANNAMPKSGGTFTGGITLASGAVTVNQSNHQSISLISNNSGHILSIYENGNWHEVIHADFKGNITGGNLMPKANFSVSGSTLNISL